MARVNVEQYALTDPRYAVLGSLLGVDQWSALGRMLVVWNQCQERESYILKADIVNCMFPDVSGFAEALVKSGLGKKHRHGIYISGTRGRIEWLAKKRVKARENGPKGGRPKKTDDEPTMNRRRLRSETPVSVSVTPTEKTKRATRVPDSFVITDEMRQWAAKECPTVDIDLQMKSFVDYWTGVPGQKGSKLDWLGTWRNHVRDCAEKGRFQQKSFHLPRLPSKPPSAEVLAYMNSKSKP